MRITLALLLVLIISGCANFQIPMELRRILTRITPDLVQHNVVLGDQVFIRIFKEENILELWMKSEDSSRFTLVKTYPICKWSGALGPKFREGDHQAPEGFYATTEGRLNPKSQYHLAFNIGYPNAYDRSLKRTGSFIMVHGDCASEGCYAMTDTLIEEIYLIVERALQAGQTEVPIHIFPFKMTTERLISEFASPHFSFWMNLRDGYDYFEKTGVPPKWRVENGQYKFY